MNKEETQETQETSTGEFTSVEALNVLVQAVRFAQGKGVYSLEDAEMISKAIKVFTPPTDTTVEAEEIKK